MKLDCAADDMRQLQRLVEVLLTLCIVAVRVHQQIDTRDLEALQLVQAEPYQRMVERAMEAGTEAPAEKVREDQRYLGCRRGVGQRDRS